MDFDWNQLVLLIGGYWNQLASLISDYWVEVWSAVIVVQALIAWIVFYVTVAGWVLRPGFVAVARFGPAMRDRIEEAMRRPLELAVVVLGLYVAGQVLVVSGELESVLHWFTHTLAVLALSWLLSRAVRVVAETITASHDWPGKEMVHWGGKLIGILVWLVGFASVLELWGVRVAPLLASLSILGVAISLGAQDFFKNLISASWCFRRSGTRSATASSSRGSWTGW